MLQCHNIVNSKTLLLQFLSYVQETKYCAAGKQADILPDSKIINCKQTKLLFLIKISWLVFKRKGLKSYKFNSKTKTNAKTYALYIIILLFSESVSKVVLFQNFNFSLLSVYGLMHGQNLLYKARTRKSISWLLIGKWILYRWRPSKIDHRTFRFHFTICIDYTLVLCSYRLFYVSSLT